MGSSKLRDLRSLFNRTNVRLLALRQHLDKNITGVPAVSPTEVNGKCVHAFLVDTADAHQSEYVSAANKRRAWLSGFTGSSGTGILLKILHTIRLS